LKREVTARFAGILLTLIVLTGCSSTGLLPPAGVPVTGVWGGHHVRATLSETGAEIEYDCAHGKITEALLPDAVGAFNAKGVHFREHGGPIRQDEKPDSLSARYTGSIRNNVMKLEVELATGMLGPFTLSKGTEARVIKCL